MYENKRFGYNTKIYTFMVHTYNDRSLRDEKLLCSSRK